MNEQQTELLLHILQRQMNALETIADSLSAIVSEQNITPNYQRKISEFKNFDWASINTVVIKSDLYGAAVVEWNSYQFTRRNPSNKFGEAIWFSRSIGQVEGKNVYKRLITFKKDAPSSAEAIPEKTRNYL